MLSVKIGFVILFCIFSNSHTHKHYKNDKNDTVKIYYDSEVFFISSADDIKTKSFLWKYSGPEGYGFKIVLRSINVSLVKELSIENSTDSFVNKRSAKEYHPYYNSDNYLQIYLSLYDNQDVVFSAYLTIVNKIPVKNLDPDGGIHDFCPFLIFPENMFIWMIIEPLLLGQSFNINCSLDFVVSPGEEFDITTYSTYIEKNVDFLKYSFYTEKNVYKTVLVDFLPNAPNPFLTDVENTDPTIILSSYNNGSKKHYFWEWITDGSITSLGIILKFDKIKCKCKSHTIKCNKPVGIMGKHSGRYCGNLKCNFTILPCTYPITLLTIKLTECYPFNIGPRNYIYETFKVFSNDSVALEINNYNRLEQDFDVYLNPYNHNVFEAHTVPSDNARCLLLSTQHYRSEVKNDKVFFTLSSFNPFTLLDIGMYPKAVIIIISEIPNSTLTLFSNKARGVPLYEKANFYKRYINSFCFSNYNLYQCEIVSNKIGILFPNGKSELPNGKTPILYISNNNFHSIGCIFKKNVFSFNANTSEMSFVVISTDKDECIATVLLDIQKNIYYSITYFWTNVKAETVKISAGLDQPFFEFNANQKRTKLDLLSELYTIKLPKQASVYIRIERETGGFIPSEFHLKKDKRIVINVFNPNFYGFLSTPAYGTSKTVMINAITYFFGNFSLKFTTLHFSLNHQSEGFVFFKYEKDKHVQIISTVNETGNTFIFKKGMITLSYWLDESNVDTEPKNGVVFLVEVVKD